MTIYRIIQDIENGNGLHPADAERLLEDFNHARNTIDDLMDESDELKEEIEYLRKELECSCCYRQVEPPRVCRRCQTTRPEIAKRFQ